MPQTLVTTAHARPRTKIPQGFHDSFTHNKPAASPTLVYASPSKREPPACDGHSRLVTMTAKPSRSILSRVSRSRPALTPPQTIL